MEILQVLILPLLLLAVPLVLKQLGGMTKSDRLRKRISDHQSVLEKMPDGVSRNELQAEIDRQVSELVGYWGDRRARAAQSRIALSPNKPRVEQRRSRPLSERLSPTAAAALIGLVGSIVASLIGLFATDQIRIEIPALFPSSGPNVQAPSEPTASLPPEPTASPTPEPTASSPLKKT